MKKLNQKSSRILIIVAITIFIAYICRIPGLSGPYSREAGLLRSFIYISLCISWGFYVRKRIMQTQVRRYITAIVALMVFWFLIRSVKYHFIPEQWQPHITRYLWYLFYLPMLFIPLLAAFIAFSIGRSENYRLPKKTAFLYIPTIILFALVITNDLHQFVFTFPDDVAMWSDHTNGYAFGYFLIAGWIFFCALTMLYGLYRNCRIPGSRRRILFPCIPIAILIIYVVFYYLKSDWLRFFAGDATAVMCLLYAAALELCIRFGLIQVNTRYEELFSSATDIPVQITDQNYIIHYISRNAKPVPEERMREAEAGPVFLADGIRLHNMQIHGGHAVWTEDMSELLQLQEKLENTKEELKERNALLHYEYEREKEHKVVEEQNRLYDMLQDKTQTQIDKISRLVFCYQKTQSEKEKKQILSKIVVLGSFIKRRKDFVLSIDSTPDIPESKLNSALGESFRALAGMSVQGSYLVYTGRDYLKGEILTLAYDFFEDVVEMCLDTLSSINVRVLSVGGSLRISILTDGTGAFEKLRKKYPAAVISQDSDGASFVLPLEGGGQHDTECTSRRDMYTVASAVVPVGSG